MVNKLIELISMSWERLRRKLKNKVNRPLSSEKLLISFKRFFKTV